MFLSIVAIILIFLFSVFIHESGHAIFAIILGNRIVKICIGIGSEVCSLNVCGVRLCWHAIPFGGRVFIRSPFKSLWRKALFFFGGSFFNLLGAFVGICIIHSHYGSFIKEADITKNVGWIDHKSIFYKNGIRAGDKILCVNNYSVSVLDLIKEIHFLRENEKRWFNISFAKDCGDVINKQILIVDEDAVKIMPASRLCIQPEEPVMCFGGDNVWNDIIYIGSLHDNKKLKDYICTIMYLDRNDKEIKVQRVVCYDREGLCLNMDSLLKDLHDFDGKNSKVNGLFFESEEDFIKIINNKKFAIDLIIKGRKSQHIVFLDDCNTICKDSFTISLSKNVHLPLNLKKSNLSCWDTFKFYIMSNINIMKHVFGGSGKAISMIKGPYGTIRDSIKISYLDTLTLFTFFSILNIQWAFINLLPLYFLDGGSIVSCIFRIIFGKRFSCLNYVYFLFSASCILIVVGYQIYRLII